MDEKQKNEIALFRYGVIAPLIQRQCEETKPWTYFRKAEKLKYEKPGGEKVAISSTTIARWYRDYLKKGFDCLKPLARSDVGLNRKIDDELREKIAYFIKEYPRLPAAQIYMKLIADCDISKDSISLSTISCFVSGCRKNNHLNSRNLNERREHRIFCLHS